MQVNDFLLQLCEHCGVDTSAVEVKSEEDGDYLRVNLEVPQEDSGLFIGYHGETLESIQRLLRLVFQRVPEDKKILLNVNQYREQREEKLQEMTRTIAQRVLESGSEYVFHSFLPPHERFVIHTTLSELPEFEALESVSVGTGKERKLRIRKKQS